MRPLRAYRTFGMSAPIGLQLRLGAMFLLAAIVPGGIVMAFAFHLDGPAPTAVGICIFTLLPTIVVAFLLGSVRAQKIYQDATKQWERYHAERARNARLAELNQLRSTLVSSASHELRTPMSSLTVYLDALADNWDSMEDTQRRETIARTRRIAKRMNRLTSDLLLAAQIQADSVSIDLEAVTLAPLVAQACGEVAALHPDLAVETAGDPGCLVLGDGLRIQQMLVNLLDNAAKFAAEGSTIRVEWITTGGSAELCVYNQGEPISAGRIEDLFQPFSRLVGGAAAPVGTGLGLYICKRLVDAMGGQMVARAERGGMLFGFILPAGQFPPGTEFAPDFVTSSSDRGGT